MGGSKGTQLRAILDALMYLKLRLPHGKTESLLTWTPGSESQGQPSILRIVLHDALLPNFVIGLDKNTPSQREAKRLVSNSCGLAAAGRIMSTRTSARPSYSSSFSMN